jgi:hypothetical protein
MSAERCDMLAFVIALHDEANGVDILRDDRPDERQLGIEARLTWGAVAAGIPVEYRSLGNG